MATEKMYDLAFQLKGTKLWQRLYDDEIFAVKLSDDRIGYCSVMGRLEDHLALGLYIGDEGYQSYRILLDADPDTADKGNLGAILTSQSCLQCSFENKDMLSEDELAEVRAYAQAHGRSFRGKKAFPQFTKFRTGKFPWKFDPDDEPLICDALSAAVALQQMLDRQSKKELGLLSLLEDVDQIPMLVREDDHWRIQSTPLPSAERTYPEPAFTNEVLAVRLKKKQKRGKWECGTMFLPEAIQDEDDPEAVPYFPLALVFVDPETGKVHLPIMENVDDTAELMNEFAAKLLEKDFLPRTICCGDDRCFALLKDLCEKTGIRLERTDALEVLGDVMEDMMEHIGPDDGEPDFKKMDALIENLTLMSDGELRQMPKQLVDMLYDMADLGILPDELCKRISKVFRRK